VHGQGLFRAWVQSADTSCQACSSMVSSITHKVQIVCDTLLAIIIQKDVEFVLGQGKSAMSQELWLDCHFFGIMHQAVAEMLRFGSLTMLHSDALNMTSVSPLLPFSDFRSAWPHQICLFLASWSASSLDC